MGCGIGLADISGSVPTAESSSSGEASRPSRGNSGALGGATGVERHAGVESSHAKHKKMRVFSRAGFLFMDAFVTYISLPKASGSRNVHASWFFRIGTKNAHDYAKESCFGNSSI